MKFADELRVTGVSKHALAARYGGEEFVMILPGSNKELASSVSADVLTRLKTKAWQHEGNEWGYVSVSIGSKTVLPEHQNTGIAEMYKRAYALLYEAKENGRNQFRAE